MFATGAAGWRAVAARAAVALAAGLTVTFSSDHSATFGLLVFGAFAAVTALILVWGGQRTTIGAVRLGSWAAAAAAAGTAVIAFSGGGLTVLVTALVGFAAVTGAIELGLGLRLRAQTAHARDGVIAGILSLLFAAIVLLVPTDFANAWQTVTKEGSTVSGVVTADVVVVGVFGAYAFVLGVFLAIAAVSVRQAAGAAPTGAREPARVSGER